MRVKNTVTFISERTKVIIATDKDALIIIARARSEPNNAYTLFDNFQFAQTIQNGQLKVSDVPF